MSQQDALNLVNSARARHGVPPLQWDDGLSHNATAWAEHEAHEIHAMRHSGGDQRPNVSNICVFEAATHANEFSHLARRKSVLVVVL